MFPWKDFFDGTDKGNSKNMKGRMEERKRRDFLLLLFFLKYGREVPILMCSPLVGNTLGLPASGEPTRMVTSLMAMRC
jgi:hypothetical protein